MALCIVTSQAHAQQDDAPKVSVGVVSAERKPISKAQDFVGRVDAVDRVEIRARVTGFLDEIEFKEGDTVKEGDPLYRIEKGLFQAAVGQAEGALERSKAAKVLTEVQLQRAADLLAKNVGSVAARDQASAADEQAKGTILVDQANREFLRAQQEGRQVDVTGIKARLRFADGSKYDQQGSINFVDVTVDRTTDTVLVRATFPNPAGALIDGQLVRVDLESGKPEEKVVVPQAALIADQEGVYVFVVDNGKAAVKRIKVGGEIGSGVVVTEGLEGGEQVIVEGLQGVRPGVTVRASPLPQTFSRS
jgi:membrane fusion protein (multidrug efflux system)